MDYKLEAVSNVKRRNILRLHIHYTVIEKVSVFFRDIGPDIGTQVDSTAGKSVITVAVVARLGRTQGGIALADGITLIAQAVIKEVVVTHREEHGVTLPDAIDKMGIVLAIALEEAVPHIDIEIVKFALVKFR